MQVALTMAEGSKKQGHLRHRELIGAWVHESFGGNFAEVIFKENS